MSDEEDDQSVVTREDVPTTVLAHHPSHVFPHIEPGTSEENESVNVEELQTLTGRFPVPKEIPAHRGLSEAQKREREDAKKLQEGVEKSSIIKHDDGERENLATGISANDNAQQTSSRDKFQPKRLSEAERLAQEEIESIASDIVEELKALTERFDVPKVILAHKGLSEEGQLKRAIIRKLELEQATGKLTKEEAERLEQARNEIFAADDPKRSAWEDTRGVETLAKTLGIAKGLEKLEAAEAETSTSEINALTDRLDVPKLFSAHVGMTEEEKLKKAKENGANRNS